MPQRPALRKLTLSLLKEGAPRTQALRDVDAVTSHIVPALSASTPSLFIASTSPHPPPWKALLDPHVTGGLADLYTASSSAVLLFESSERVFAVTFGQGRHLLDSNVFEPDFGLKVVLNTVAPDQLKSVDAKTIDETPMHTRRDVSRDSSFSAFGLDMTRDLLRAVTGTPRDETLAHRLTGSDALGLHTRIQVPDLPALASRLLDAYRSDNYREHFDFVDFLRPEKSVERLGELEDRLVTALKDRAITDLHLAAPEPLDWLDIDGFRFSTQPKNSELDSDPRISVYLNSRATKEVTPDLLRYDRLQAIRATDGLPQASWPVLRCIVYETELDGQLYALSGGEWFRINRDFKDRVYDAVGKLGRLEGLPDADAGTSEDAYNVKAATALGALCLDKKLVYEDGPDKMEICDILTRGGGLIHVKHRGSSSTLSHLFAQGVNSAERLLQDGDFRQNARAVAASTNVEFSEVLPAARPDPGSHEIGFVVITRSDRATPLTLPFFSLVSLRAAASRLQGYGFRVAVAAVKETS